MKQYAYKVVYGCFSQFHNSLAEARKTKKIRSKGFDNVNIYEHNPFATVKKIDHADEDGVWILLKME